MLTRNVFLLFSMFVLLVEGDLDSTNAGIQAISTDKDSTSDEAPTESMNAVSPDQPDESQMNYYGGGPSDTSSSSSETADAANQEAATEPAAASAAASANSVEEEDEDESQDSEEGGKKKFSSRSARPQSPALFPQPPTHDMPNPAHSQLSPALPRQAINPQPKVLVRNRTSKRRSRTNRRQI